MIKKFLYIFIFISAAVFAMPAKADTSVIEVNFNGNGPSAKLFEETNYLPGDAVTRSFDVRNITSNPVPVFIKVEYSFPDYFTQEDIDQIKKFGGQFDLIIKAHGASSNIYEGSLTGLYNAEYFVLDPALAPNIATSTYDVSAAFNLAAGNEYQVNSLSFNILVSSGDSIINENCGNGTINEDEGEQCDLGLEGNGACPSTCSNACTLNECGDGGGGVCGNGIREGSEACDLGIALNGLCSSLCSRQCQTKVDDCGGGGTNSPDISVLKTTNNLSPKEQDTVTFTINVRNVGSVDAANVILTDLLPNGLTYVNSTPSIGQYVPGTGIWEIGTSTPNVTQTLIIEATVNSGTANTSITNTATVASDSDSNSSNNSSSVQLHVQGNGGGGGSSGGGGGTSYYCGDGYQNSGEQCDNGANNGPYPNLCSIHCTLNTGSVLGIEVPGLTYAPPQIPIPSDNFQFVSGATKPPQYSPLTEPAKPEVKGEETGSNNTGSSNVVGTLSFSCAPHYWWWFIGYIVYAVLLLLFYIIWGKRKIWLANLLGMIILLAGILWWWFEPCPHHYWWAAIMMLVYSAALSFWNFYRQEQNPGNGNVKTSEKPSFVATPVGGEVSDSNAANSHPNDPNIKPQ